MRDSTALSGETLSLISQPPSGARRVYPSVGRGGYGASSRRSSDPEVPDDVARNSDHCGLNSAVAHISAYWREYVTSQNLQSAGVVALLFTATATERVTFKLMIDHMQQFKLILVQIVFLLSSLIFTGLTYAKQQYIGNDVTANEMKQFPQSQILFMALVDTLPFLLLVLATPLVSPTMTVIMIHASTVGIVLYSKFLFPYRLYTQTHYVGIAGISVAIAICLLKAMFIHMDLGENSPNSDISSGTKSSDSNNLYISICSWTFVVAAGSLGLCTLYKEKNIIEWGHPVDNYYLSAWTFFYQLCITILISMLYFIVATMAGYCAMDEIFSNAYGGWMCFLGQNIDVHSSSSTHVRAGDEGGGLDCRHSAGLIIGYILANAVAILCLGYIVTRLSQSALISRVTQCAIVLAFLCLWYYDLGVNDTNIFHGNAGILDMLAMIFLLAGLQIYEYEAEPDVEIITNRSNVYASSTSGMEEKSDTITP